MKRNNISSLVILKIKDESLRSSHCVSLTYFEVPFHDNLLFHLIDDYSFEKERDTESGTQRQRLSERQSKIEIDLQRDRD